MMVALHGDSIVSASMWLTPSAISSPLTRTANWCEPLAPSALDLGTERDWRRSENRELRTATPSSSHQSAYRVGWRPSSPHRAFLDAGC